MSAAPQLVGARPLPLPWHDDPADAFYFELIEVHLRELPHTPPPKAREVTPEQYDAIKRAVRIACAGKPVTAEDRFDLRQDIVISLLEQQCPIANVDGWIFVTAKNFTASLLRDRKRRLELENEHWKSGGTRRRYRTGPNWKPTWYPPHPDAQRYCPMPSPGARLIEIHPSTGVLKSDDPDEEQDPERPPRDVQGAMADWIDAGGFEGYWKRTRAAALRARREAVSEGDTATAERMAAEAEKAKRQAVSWHLPRVQASQRPEVDAPRVVLPPAPGCSCPSCQNAPGARLTFEHKHTSSYKSSAVGKNHADENGNSSVFTFEATEILNRT